MSTGKAGPHKIQGIGAGFIPNTLDTKVYDEVIPVSNEDSFEYSKYIAKEEGVLVGISSGAALKAAIEVAKRPEFKGKTVVALLPDSGDRYYSTDLFKDYDKIRKKFRLYLFRFADESIIIKASSFYLKQLGKFVLRRTPVWWLRLRPLPVMSPYGLF